MYKYKKASSTSIKRNESYEGERIEQKIDRIVNNKEPIEDSAPLIYTDRKEGVLPDYNIRTDRFEHAIEAMDKVDKSLQAKRLERLQNKDHETKNETKSQSTQGIETGQNDIPAT